MGIQVEIIQRYGGDVDKMIGDAIFARLQELDCELSAFDAACKI